MSDDVTAPAKSGDLLAKIATALGIISTLIGVVVTVSTARLKSFLDRIDIQLKQRSQEVEESKERVARYT